MDLSSIFRFSDMVEYFPKILSRFPVTLLIVVVSVAGAGPGIYSGSGTYL